MMDFVRMPGDSIQIVEEVEAENGVNPFAVAREWWESFRPIVARRLRTAVPAARRQPRTPRRSCRKAPADALLTAWGHLMQDD